MKVSILQENLAQAISIVSRAVAARSTLPILGNILLTAEKDTFKLSATNLEIGIIRTAAAKVDQSGAITVPAKQFADYVSALPPDRVDLHLNAKTQTLHLKCANYKANIKGVDASEFPVIPTFEKKDLALIQPDDLRELIARALVSVAQDESRPVLKAVNAIFKPKSVDFVSADGFRLTMACAPLERELPELMEALIPGAALQEVSRLAAKTDEPIAIAFSKNATQVMFEMGDTLLVANLVEGKFPDFNAILPKSFNTRAVCNTGELEKSVRAALVFARDASYIVRLRLEAKNGNSAPHIQIVGQSDATGDAETSIETEMDGDGMEIGFNGKFLLDALAVANSPQIALELTDSASGSILKPVGSDTYQYLVMPMHITEMRKPI
jgi:DNA polymerase-3 subunit beta